MGLSIHFMWVCPEPVWVLNSVLYTDTWGVSGKFGRNVLPWVIPNVIRSVLYSQGLTCQTSESALTRMSEHAFLTVHSPTECLVLVSAGLVWLIQVKLFRFCLKEFGTDTTLFIFILHTRKTCRPNPLYHQHC